MVLLACRLIALDKKPGVLLIGIVCHIIAKSSLATLKSDISEAVGFPAAMWRSVIRL